MPTGYREPGPELGTLTPCPACPSSVGSARQPREGVKAIPGEVGDRTGRHLDGPRRWTEKPVSELRLFTPKEGKENPEEPKS